jgi:hypothetical protein
MFAHVKLGPLAVELGRGAVARVREPARVLQTGGEHWENEGGHGCSSILATGPSNGAKPGGLSGIQRGTLAPHGGLADDVAP